MNGIGNGAVYASLALALVLIYRTTGILNFAQGEMALFSTYVMWWFTDPGLPVWLVDPRRRWCISFVGGALDRTRRDPAGGAVVAARASSSSRSACSSRSTRSRRCISASTPKALPRAYPEHTGGPATCSIRADTLVLVGVLAVECLLLYALAAADEGRSRVPRGRVEPRVEPAARRLGRDDVDARLGDWPPRSARLAGALVVPTTHRAHAPRRCSRSSSSRSPRPRSADSTVTLGAVVGGLIVGVAQSLTTPRSSGSPSGSIV